MRVGSLRWSTCIIRYFLGQERAKQLPLSTKRQGRREITVRPTRFSRTLTASMTRNAGGLLKSAVAPERLCEFLGGRSSLLRTLLLSTATVVATSVVLSAAASASAGQRVFYLTTHPRQCLIATGPTAKSPLAVPCSDPRHNMEVYAVGHGGWGHHHPPASKTVIGEIARAICLSAFQRLTGHPLPANSGWNAYFPDPGSETARYGDKIICGYGPGHGWLPLAAAGTFTNSARRHEP